MSKLTVMLTALVLIASCRTTQGNKSIVSNSGAPDEKNEYPQTLKIDLTNDKKQAVCTGQLIDTDLLLTAAHCILHGRLKMENGDGKTQFTFELYNSYVGIVSFNDKELGYFDVVTVHPSYIAKANAKLGEINKTPGQWGPGKFGFEDQYEKGTFNTRESWKKMEEFLTIEKIAFEDDVVDLAIVKLKRDEEGKDLNPPLVKLYNKDPQKGQKVGISGYGLKSAEAFLDSVRRVGWTTLSAVEPNVVWTRVLTADMNKEGSTIPYGGDSGGMLYDYETKTGVGILTGSRVGDIDGQRTEFGVWVNLRSENARNFICKAAPRACE